MIDCATGYWCDFYGVVHKNKANRRKLLALFVVYRVIHGAAWYICRIETDLLNPASVLVLNSPSLVLPCPYLPSVETYPQT